MALSHHQARKGVIGMGCSIPWRVRWYVPAHARRTAQPDAEYAWLALVLSTTLQPVQLL